jgi:hypothetical protein
LGGPGGTHGWLIDGEAGLDKDWEQLAQSHACEYVHGATKVENHKERLVEESQDSGEGDNLPKNVRSSSPSHARRNTGGLWKAERQMGKQANKAEAKHMNADEQAQVKYLEGHPRRSFTNVFLLCQGEHREMVDERCHGTRVLRVSEQGLVCALSTRRIPSR